MDLKSILGYSLGSPYASHPYIDINSNVIDMSRTPIDLWGVDQKTGKKIRMKANDKNPYIFEGNVREIPTGNIYQDGGSVYDFLFGDDEEQPEQQQVEQPEQQDNSAALEEYMASQEQKRQEDEQYNLAMQVATDSEEGNPYLSGVQQGASQGFQQFSSYQAGRDALEHQLDLYQTGKTRNRVGPNSSIFQAMSVYAPVGDGRNDPYAYAQRISKRLGVPITTPISQIDKKKWADVIEEVEGNKKGNNPGNLRSIRK